jgi:hypothetical protein
MKNTQEYSTSKYLIYSCFETIPKAGESSIGGSLLMGCAQTEEEALQTIEILKQRQAEFNAKFPLSMANSKDRFVHIVNTREWWSHRR